MVKSHMKRIKEKQEMVKPVSGFMQKTCFGLGVLFLCVSASAVLAAEAPASNTTLTATEQESAAASQQDADVPAPDAQSLVSPPYTYQLSARPDPFKPFIAPKTVDSNELVDTERELTGMQLFEPGQLTLVATMDTPNGRMAMVEDVTKKGYMLKVGILIGRYGEVTEITRDQVVVTETAHTRGGEEIKTVVAMKLKRDGEGQ